VTVEDRSFGVALVNDPRAPWTLLLEVGPPSRVLLRETDFLDGHPLAAFLALIPARDGGALLVTDAGLYRVDVPDSFRTVLAQGDAFDDGSLFLRPMRVLATEPSGWAVLAETTTGGALVRVAGARATPVLRSQETVPGAGRVEEVGVSVGGPALDTGPNHTIVFSVRTEEDQFFVLLAAAGGVQVLGPGEVLETDGLQVSSEGLSYDASGGWSRSPLETDVRFAPRIPLSSPEPWVDMLLTPTGPVPFDPIQGLTPTEVWSTGATFESFQSTSVPP
jgi:hypothetical protein